MIDRRCARFGWTSLVALAAVVTVGVAMAAPPTAAASAAQNTGAQPSGVPPGDVFVFASSDVPKPIPDFDPNGVTSVVNVTNVGTIGDVDLILDDLTHACDSDLRLELTSPAGTTVVLIAAGIENGILSGISCPQNFIATVLDDGSPVNLRDGFPPYTNRLNLTHPSVGEAPLATFRGEDADGAWTLRVIDRNADDTGTLNAWSLSLSPVLPPIYTSSDVPKDIPDNDPAGITSTLEVPVNGAILDLDLLLDEVRHTCLSDLEIELTSPAGTTVVLIRIGSQENAGIFDLLGCPVDFMRTAISDQAPVNLRNGAAPFFGTFNIDYQDIVPMPLSQFNGENVHGTWTLRVKDLSPNDTGSLNHWSLRPRIVTGGPCDGDFDHSGIVTINELIKAVNNALGGCP